MRRNTSRLRLRPGEDVSAAGCAPTVKGERRVPPTLHDLLSESLLVQSPHEAVRSCVHLDNNLSRWVLLFINRHRCFAGGLTACLLVRSRLGLLKVRLIPDLWGREVPAGRMATCLQRTTRSFVRTWWRSPVVARSRSPGSPRTSGSRSPAYATGYFFTRSNHAWAATSSADNLSLSSCRRSDSSVCGPLDE